MPVYSCCLSKLILTYACSSFVRLFLIALWLLVVLASQWLEWAWWKCDFFYQQWLYFSSHSVFLYLFVFVHVLRLFLEPGDSVNVLASNEQRWLHRQRRKIWGKQNEPHCPQTVLPSLARTLFWSWRIFNFSKKKQSRTLPFIETWLGYHFNNAQY